MVLKFNYNFLKDKGSFIYLLNDIKDQNKFFKRLKIKLN